MPITYVLGPWNDPVGHGGLNQHIHLECRTSAECVVVGNWILRQDPLARVSEHPAFGGVNAVHRGRAHYEHRALDVNLSYGSPPAERPFLERLRMHLPVGLDVQTLASQIKQPQPAPPPEDDMFTPDDRNKLNATALLVKVLFDDLYASGRNAQGLKEVSGRKILERLHTYAVRGQTADEADEQRDASLPRAVADALDFLGTWDVPADK